MHFVRWDCTDPDNFDRIRFAHVGSDPQFKSATPGPVYSDLKVISYDAD